MTSEELWEWIETCPTSAWAAIEQTGTEIVVYFPIDDEADKEET